jgi:serine/threonine protein phosphatase PrpC
MTDAVAPASSTGRAGIITLNVFGRTDVGQIREHNEDNFLVADLTKKTRSLTESERRPTVGNHGVVLGVCDGMGGAAAGEVASQLAVDIIYERFIDTDPPSDHDVLARRLVRAVEAAGQRIFNEARMDRTRRGMGTTATIAALVDSRMFVAQVGDSRAYILRSGVMMQVTRDQSLVTQLIEAGQLTEEEAETFEHNNIILQALGTADTVQVDLTFVDLRRGDRLMMCSDGLTGMIRAEEIRQVLLNQVDPLQACKELTDRANAAGGHDNITVIVADFDGDGLMALGQEEDTICYRKYALGEEPASGSMAWIRPVASNPPPSGPLSDEASREDRALRVAHTVLGLESPLVDSEAPTLAPARDGAGPSSPVYDPGQEPINLPISGWPPAAVGALVVGVMAAAAIAGYFVFH